MKNWITIILITLATIIFFTSCPLVNSVLGQGSEKEDFFYGMVEANNTIFLSSWLHDSIVNIGGEVIESVSEKPHGIATTDGLSFWVTDVNEQRVQNYGGNEQTITVSGQPVNVLLTDNTLYIADREEDSILYYDYDNPSGTVTLPSEKEYDLHSYLDEDTAIGYIDMFKEGNTLYVASDEYDGYITIDLDDGTTQSQPHSAQANDFGATGIVVDNTDVYINTGNRIRKYDGTSWTNIADDVSADAGYEYSGKYIDLILSTTCYGGDEPTGATNYLYVAAGINPTTSEDETPHHIIRYHFDGTQWVFSKVIDVNFDV